MQYERLLHAIEQQVTVGADNLFVVDPLEGKYIECFMDQKITWQGSKYFLCYPSDTPVAIARLSDAQGVSEVQEKHFEGLFDAARDVLAGKGLGLLPSAVALTVQGQVREQVELTPPPHEVLEGSEEFVRILAKFLYRNEIHMVFSSRPTPADAQLQVTELLDPVLIVCKEGALSRSLLRDLKDKFKNEEIQVLEVVGELDLITVFPKIEDVIAKRFVRFLPHQ